MDDVNEELSREDILGSSKDFTLEFSEEFTSLLKDIDDNDMKRFLDELQSIHKKEEQ